MHSLEFMADPQIKRYTRSPNQTIHKVPKSIDTHATNVQAWPLVLSLFGEQGTVQNTQKYEADLSAKFQWKKIQGLDASMGVAKFWAEQSLLNC